MRKLSLLLLLILFLTPWNSSRFTIPIAQKLQEKCAQINPVQDPTARESWSSLVCGQSLKNSTLDPLLKASGLLHIFVVSGSHFFVLKTSFEFLKIPLPIIHVLLVIYNFITGFSAPGTRACLHSLLHPHLKILGEQKILCISLVSLTLNPDWLYSYSFWLSWLASLVLELAMKDRFLVVQNSLYFLIWQLMGQKLTPWSLPLNVVVAPLIGWVLFPLALLSHLPGFDLVFTFAIHALKELLQSLGLEKEKVPFGFDLWGLALLTLSVHFCATLKGLLKRGRTLS